MKTTNKYDAELGSNHIRAFRRKLGLRLADVADIMGFESFDRVSNWERGRAQPGLVNLVRLCKIYGVTLDELYPDLCRQIDEEIRGSRNRNFARGLER